MLRNPLIYYQVRSSGAKAARPAGPIRSRLVRNTTTDPPIHPPTHPPTKPPTHHPSTHPPTHPPTHQPTNQWRIRGQRNKRATPTPHSSPFAIPHRKNRRRITRRVCMSKYRFSGRRRVLLSPAWAVSIFAGSLFSEHYSFSTVLGVSDFRGHFFRGFRGIFPGYAIRTYSS